MSEEKLLELYRLAEKKGDKSLQIMALEKIKEIRNPGYSDLSPIPASGFGETVPPTEKESSPVLGSLEAAGTLATGATGGSIGYIGGFLEQLYKEISVGNFGSPEAAARIAETAGKRSAQLTYMPKTETGQEIVGAIGEAAGALPPVIGTPAITGLPASAATMAVQERLKRKLGSRIIDEKTNLPTGDFQKSLDRAGVDFSIIMDDVDNVPEFSNRATSDQIVDSIIKKKINTGSGNSALHDKMLVDGNIVKDDLGSQAVRQGFREGDVASAKNANKQTRNLMRKMNEMKRQIEAESSKALDFRPSDIPGEELLNRFNVVKDEGLSLSKQLSDISKNKLKGKVIDSSGVEKSVIDSLDSLGMDIPNEILMDTTQLKNYLSDKKVFEGTDISKDKSSQKVIRDVVDILTENGAEADKAHRVKRQIDTMIDWKKKSFEGLSDTGKNFAKSVRRSINDSIREISPEYARVNDELSSIFKVMEDFTDAIPKKIDLDSATGAAAAGQELRKLLTNYSSRNNLRDSIKAIDNLAGRYGYDSPIDINKLVQFNNTLDDRFSATPRGGFQGSIESAIRDPKQAAKDKAAEKLFGVYEAIRGFKQVTDEEAFNVMQELLSRD